MREGYICPVCGYPNLFEPARSPSGGGSNEICPSCGFEFGYTDDEKEYSYESWRARWIGLGMRWRAQDIQEPPPGWDPQQQLANLLNGDEPSVDDD